MAAYDSDSSLSDASSAVTTNVLLGYASRTPTDDDISQLGGVPVCFTVTDPLNRLIMLAKYHTLQKLIVCNIDMAKPGKQSVCTVRTMSQLQFIHAASTPAQWRYAGALPRP